MSGGALSARDSLPVRRGLLVRRPSRQRSACWQRGLWRGGPSANVGAWQPRAALRRSESTSPRVHFSDWAQGACRCLRVQGLEPTVGNVPCPPLQRVAPEGMISPQKKRPRFRRRPPVLRSPEEGLRAAQSCRRYTPRLSARQTRRTEASPPGCPAAAHRRSRGH